MSSALSGAAWRLLRAAGAALLIVMLAGGSPVFAAAAPAASAPRPGLARIWVYRTYEPFQTLARPYVRLNGAVTAISEPGGAFYRDVAPGRYLVTVDSDGQDAYQFATVELVPGQTVYLQVQSLRGWDSGGGGGDAGGGGGYERDTFYTRLMPPETAQREIAREPFYGGG